MKKLYIKETTSLIETKIYSYYIVFRKKLYPVYPVDSLKIYNKLNGEDDIYMFFDNRKIKKLGQLKNFEVVDLKEFYK